MGGVLRGCHLHRNLFSGAVSRQNVPSPHPPPAAPGRTQGLLLCVWGAEHAGDAARDARERPHAARVIQRLVVVAVRAAL